MLLYKYYYTVCIWMNINYIIISRTEIIILNVVSFLINLEDQRIYFIIIIISLQYYSVFAYHTT